LNRRGRVSIDPRHPSLGSRRLRGLHGPLSFFNGQK
jgi:hypothetical protein